jgi:hypothetical protein
MSVLAFPRLYLRGEMSWDPPVSNNIPDAYNSGTANAAYRPDEDPDAFRARMIRQTVERGDWNYFGTHRCLLEETTVVGGTLAASEADIVAAEEDPMITAPVHLVGKLVDIDPYGIVSQVFFDELIVGVPGRPHLRARPRRRMTARWITFGRNRNPIRLAVAGHAAAAWQAVFPAEDLEIVRADRSPLLSRLKAALDDENTLGLMLRLSTYYTRYFTRDVGTDGVVGASDDARRAAVDAATAALAARHARGEVVSNPAYSKVVGTLGLWLAGDSEATISGRHLVPVPRTPPPPPQPLPPPRAAAPAAAQFHSDSGVLSLDLSNTIPEVDTTLKKSELGPITVSATRAGVTTELGIIKTTDYDLNAYQARGGIVDLRVTDPAGAAELIREGRLALRIGAAVTVADRELIAQERELVAFCDDACVYLEDGQTRQVSVVVRERGAIPTRPLSLVVAAYDSGRDDAIMRDPQELPATGTVAVQVDSSERVIEHLGLFVIPADQVVTVPVTLALGTGQFLSVRTLPADDDLAAMPEGDLNWELVFDKVLSHYHAVTPRMSTIIDLSDRDAVRTFAARILEVTDPALFETSRYMPVTRDMSANRRMLLRRYCAMVLGERLPAVAPPVKVAPVGVAAVGATPADAGETGIFPKTTQG